MLCFFSLFFSSVFFSFFFQFFVSFNFSLFSCFLVFLVSVLFFLFFLALFFLFLFFLLLFFLFLFLSVPFLFVSFPFLSFSFFFVLVLVLLHSPFPLPLSRSFSSRLSFFCCFCLSFFLSFPPCVSWLLSGGFDSHPFQEWIYSLNVSWSLSLDSSGFEERLNHAPAVSQIVVPGFWSWDEKSRNTTVRTSNCQWCQRTHCLLLPLHDSVSCWIHNVIFRLPHCSCCPRSLWHNDSRDK